MLVKIRKESKYFIIYFVELRRMLGVNKTGAEVVDYFFNKNFSINRIIEKINNNKKKNIDNKKIQKRNISEFLKEIKKELLKVYQGGYPIVEKEQMSIPIAVELQITNKCNLRCKHCCQNNYSQTMPFKKIKEILKVLNKSKVFEISLVGGEVFTNSDFWKILLLCNKYNFAVNIVTNGTLLDSKIIKKISKFKNIVFLISLEGVGENNDKIRGDGVFKKVDNAIKELKKNEMHVEISTTISNLNINNYQEIIEYSKKLDVACNFNLFKPFNEEQKKFIIEPKRYFDFVDDIFKQRKKYGAKIGLTNAAIVSFLNKQEQRNECRATLSGLTINVNGGMVPCPFLKLAGYYNKAKLPKLNKDFLNIWKNNYFFKKFRRGNLLECQACSYIFSGGVDKVDPYGIKEFKKYKKGDKK